MKKILSLLLMLILMISVAGCSNTADPVDSAPPSSTSSTDPITEVIADPNAPENPGSYLYESMIIDIVANEDGYYSLMSDIYLNYDEGFLTSIEVLDPAVLAFQVSSDRGNGVYLIDKPDGDQMVADLTEMSATLKSIGRSDLAEKIDAILEIMDSSGPITQAST